MDIHPIARIAPCSSIEQHGWLALREALWPPLEGGPSQHAEHLAEMAQFLTQPERFAQFIAYDSGGQPLGLAEAALRHDYVNGTDSSPVAFLEGLYVAPQWRRQGVARALVAEVSHWAIAQGCSELASDALLDNTTSHAVHRLLGFEETERVVYFRRRLG